jgi:hypothetical protein
MTRTPLERTRQRLQAVAFVNLPLGLILLATGFTRPTIANMRTVDLIYLLGTGFCLGAGLVCSIVFLRSRREG